ncbi:unnamed protein product [Prunus armeniaca]
MERGIGRSRVNTTTSIGFLAHERTWVEGVHSGDNGTEMNGLQMHLAPHILANLETFSQVKQSCKSRLVVVCSQDPCSWRPRASSYGEKNFLIVKYNPVHECDMGFIHDKHCHASAKLVGNAVKRKLKDSRTIYTPSDIIRDVKQNFGVSINYCKAWRLRKLALMSTRGSVEEAYSLLPTYCHELEHAVGACIRGKLHEAIGECPNLVIISDQNISIETVWHNVFPTTQHGICFYHMKGNMKRTFKLKKHDKLLLYLEQAAKSYGIAEFDRHFRKIKGNDEVAQYLESAGLHKWSRAHMDGRRYNVMTTNIAESINSVLRFARMLPVVHLIDEIINLLVKWFSKRRDFALKCTSTLCPDFGEKKLRRRLECASRMNVVKLNHVEYNVMDGDMDGHVHLTNNTCSYTIYLVQPQELWVILEDVQSRVVCPPNAKVMPGQRKKLRIPSQGEDIIRRKCSMCSGTCHNKSTCKNNVPLPNVGHTL